MPRTVRFRCGIKRKKPSNFKAQEIEWCGRELLNNVTNTIGCGPAPCVSDPLITLRSLKRSPHPFISLYNAEIDDG